MVTGTVRTSTWVPGCPQAARNSGGIAGRAAGDAGDAGDAGGAGDADDADADDAGDAGAGGVALAHPATAAAARTGTRTGMAIRFMSVGRGGRMPGSWFTPGRDWLESAT
jgi:hypothetical protein